MLIPLASLLTEPLEVAGVVLAAAGLGGGWAGMMELLYGGDGASIGEALAKGTAVGFIFGMILGFAAAVYLVVD